MREERRETPLWGSALLPLLNFALPILLLLYLLNLDLCSQRLNQKKTKVPCLWVSEGKQARTTYPETSGFSPLSPDTQVWWIITYVCLILQMLLLRVKSVKIWSKELFSSVLVFWCLVSSSQGCVSLSVSHTHIHWNSHEILGADLDQGLAFLYLHNLTAYLVLPGESEPTGPDNKTVKEYNYLNIMQYRYQ